MINYDAPNVLADTFNCAQKFYHYQDLLKEENLQGSYYFPNPCVPPEDTSELSKVIPAEIPVFIHKRPLLSWSNVLWNQPTRAMVPRFDSIGKAISIHLEASEVTSESGEFDGFSSMPGVYYTRGNFPEEYNDRLFVSDFSGWIKTFKFDENNELIDIQEFMDRDTGIVDVEMHPTDGCMYYVHYNSHSINKICYGGSVPPIAALRINQQYGASPLTVEFSAAASYDPSNLDLQYFWDFGDGTISEERNPTHTFSSSTNFPTSYEVELTVTNSDGLSDVQSTIVSLNNTPPIVKITHPVNGSFYGSNDLNFLRLQAEVNDAEHNEDELDYNWQIFFHHNTHYHEEPPKTETNPSVIIEPTDCGTTEVFWYRFRLEVTDANGLTSVDELEIYPFCEPAFFDLGNLEAFGSEKSLSLIHI